ncbi:MAG: hypothetical protein ACRDZ2_00245 [Ilumatobacteraceae bacterium]
MHSDLDDAIDALGSERAFTSPKSYVHHDGDLAQPTTIEFNHGLGAVVSALLDRSMTLTQLVEHTSVPWNPLGDAMDVGDDEEWRLIDGPERLPLAYTLQAIKAR